MTPDMLRRILEETGPDYSAEVCAQADLSDLDARAIRAFRERWHRKARNDRVLESRIEQLLWDAELLTDKGITYAALILLGSHAALGRHLAQAETIFEYRSSDTPGPASQREEYREGFLLYYDRLWEIVHRRNDLQHYADGPFLLDIPTFNEGAVRETILNAVSHRDYRLAGSVFIRQFPRRIEIVSPGGWPEGITPENILDRQLPRNRRLADSLARCGLVERAGQGANRIVEACIREGKVMPDFAHSDAWQVSLTLHGELRDPDFIRWLQWAEVETPGDLDTHDLLLLQRMQTEGSIRTRRGPRLSALLDLGLVDHFGRGKGMRYCLRKPDGPHARSCRPDAVASRNLLHRHLEQEGEQGCSMAELSGLLPEQSRAQVKRLLAQLREEGRARLEGMGRQARWYPSTARGGPHDAGPKSQSEPL